MTSSTADDDRKKQLKRLQDKARHYKEVTGRPGIGVETRQQAPQPVTCLGMTFDSDAARREYFQNQLRGKLPDRYILHYTQPGDIVFDGFAGTGMTGVAAQMCGNPDIDLRRRIEGEWRQMFGKTPQWGPRKTICGDLSPIASFIAYNYNTSVNVAEFEAEAHRILEEVGAECGWMYETRYPASGIQRVCGFCPKAQSQTAERYPAGSGSCGLQGLLGPKGFCHDTGSWRQDFPEYFAGG